MRIGAAHTNLFAAARSITSELGAARQRVARKVPVVTLVPVHAWGDELECDINFHRVTEIDKVNNL